MINVIECTIDLTCKSGNPVRQLFEKFLSMALRIYIKAASDSLEAANSAAEIKLRAERRAGELLAGMEKPVNHHSIATSTTMVPLKELRISKNQSSRWQKEAKVDEDVFEGYIRECNDENKLPVKKPAISLATKTSLERSNR